MKGYHNRSAKGGFQNFSETPQLAEGFSMFRVMKDFFSRPASVMPPVSLPSVRTNLQHFYSEKPAIIWFGHSSYLIHYKGMNILVDPVLSGYASPFRFYIKAFEGSDIYKPADMPVIDLLILTHNHYDHLDVSAVKAIASKTKQVVMPLNVSKDLKGVALNAGQMAEMDWWQRMDFGNEIKLTATPSRHFSGRGLRRNGSLWSSFVLELDGYTIFIGSDSGHERHFKDIGKQFGSFDIALLECGQYNEAWPYIHSIPEELIIQGNDLHAKTLMPVHWGKFALALHEWDEPVKRFVAAADQAGIHYTTPMIGQPVILGEYYPAERWWDGLK